MDLVTRPERVRLLARLRKHPELRGFVRAAEVAMGLGLPAEAHHPHTGERLVLRRPIANEPGSVVAELLDKHGVVQVVVDDRVKGRTRRGALAVMDPAGAA